MTRRWLPLFAFGAGLCLATPVLPAAEGPAVSIVIDPQAPPLEQFAARELAGLLESLYKAQATLGPQLPTQPEPTFVIGSPATNRALAAVATTWPKLSDQGHLLRSVRLGDREVLAVGGGSPVATLWAAYEVGHQLGARYLLHGDVFPAEPSPLTTANFDLIFEPTLRLRTWRTVNDFPIGPESWGLAEQKQMLRQLAKLKYNRILVSIYPWQPFLHFEFKGVAKQTSLLWFGKTYRVDGDIAGRGVFKGAKVFENPDFAGLTDYQARREAGERLVGGILDTAHELGMTTGLLLSPLEFPREFAPNLPGAEAVHQLASLTIGPGAQQRPGDETLQQLAKAQLRGALDAYPQLDALYLTLPEFPGWSTHAPEAWDRLATRSKLSPKPRLEELVQAARQRTVTVSGDRGEAALRGNVAALDFLQTLLADPALLRSSRGHTVQPVLVSVDPALFPLLPQLVPGGAGTLAFLDYTARKSAAQRELLRTLPASQLDSSLILTLADDNVGVLPQSSVPALHEQLGELRAGGFAGFSTRYWMPGDLDYSAYYLSRAAFDAEVTPATALSGLVTPLCGAGAVDRLKLVFASIEEATALIEQHDLGFAFPVASILRKHYEGGDSVPEWWGQVGQLYLRGMNEAYRANQRSTLEGRTLTLYLARRLDFAFNYMNCVEALRKAGIAKRAGDAETHAAQLQTAVEALHDALNAQAAVARSNSDRGVIAVLNQYAYRPLKQELEALDQE